MAGFLTHRAKYYIEREIRRALSPVVSFLEYPYLSKLLNTPIGKHNRIYNIHARKTGGTSLNSAFIKALSGNSKLSFDALASKPSHRINVNGKVVVGWNRALINSGQFHYAFSHIPVWKLNLPKDTFTITCLRDPISRILSHYRMLLDFKSSALPHPSFYKECGWLGDNFEDFVMNVPKEHFSCQLFMFSKKYDLDEAKKRLETVDFIVILENHKKLIKYLSERVGLELPFSHARKSQSNFEVPTSIYPTLRDALGIEYDLYEHAKSLTDMY